MMLWNHLDSASMKHKTTELSRVWGDPYLLVSVCP